MRESCRNGVGGKAASQERHARSRKMTIDTYYAVVAEAESARVAALYAAAESISCSARDAAADWSAYDAAVDAAWSVYRRVVGAARADSE
jgi:hypothetical protein